MNMKLIRTDNHSVVEAHGQQTDDDNSERLYGLTLNLLKDIFSKVLKFPKEELEEDVLFEKYGIDSILIMNLNDYLEEKFGNISKTLLFEYQNLKDLTWYFIDNYRDKVCELTNENSADTKLSAPIQKESESKSLRVMLNDSNEICDDEIAVIGLSGKYAKADSIEEYWNNIKNGVDCISEIPQSRWDYKKYFNPDKDNQGTTYTKWGGFLNNVDGFEPLFFNISPRDAVIMDPQERLFMECAYSTLEDAGYTRKELGYAPGSEVRRNVGVYVGVMNEEYHLYAAQEQNKGNIKVLSGNISQVAKLKKLAGDDLDIYSGNDDQVIPILSLGGIGVISVLSNVMPTAVHDMVMEYLDGNIKSALDIQLKYLDLIEALFCEVNPIPVKAAMKLLGYDVGGLRLPLTELEDANRATLKENLEKLREN